ncbi:MAG: integrase [Pseudomonas sp. PGPPP3]|nr:MAG: integrase [Pseudomonas sp. PGPPP3]
MSNLTVKEVEKLTKAGAPGLTGDGGGLYFKVGSTGGSSWIYRYKIAGKARDMGLGKYPDISLAEARLLAADARKLKATGHDPLDVRDAQRAEQRRQIEQLKSFQNLATEHHKAHSGTWSEKWRKGWLRKLELYAYPVIGKLSADEIETAHLLKVLQPIWSSKTRTADEVRGQIEQILDAAKAHGLRKGENPARWRGHLENLLSKAEKKKARIRIHFPAMKWQDIPALMSKLKQNNSRDSWATRLLILTGARSHMIRFAEWREFDLQAGIWSLSAERMKARKAFDIPLPEEAIELIKTMPHIDDSPYLFPGQGKTGVMATNAMRSLLHTLGHQEITRHGFRSSFRDWSTECTNFSREVCELALAHDERSQTESAYSRSDFLGKRRILMQEWAKYATSEPDQALPDPQLETPT